MQIHGLTDILAGHPVFKDFDTDTLDLLVGCARNEHFRAGQTIYTEGDDADKVFLIREGDVSVEISTPHHEPIIVETLRAGDVLGWSWMVPHMAVRFRAMRMQLLDVYGTRKG